MSQHTGASPHMHNSGNEFYEMIYSLIPCHPDPSQQQEDSDYDRTACQRVWLPRWRTFLSELRDLQARCPPDTQPHPVCPPNGVNEGGSSPCSTHCSLGSFGGGVNKVVHRGSYTAQSPVTCPPSQSLPSLGSMALTGGHGSLGTPVPSSGALFLQK